MYTRIPTIWGAALTSALNGRQPLDVPPFTTLNEVLEDSALISQIPSQPTRGMQVTDPYDYLTDTSQMGVRGFCIGNGGHVFNSGGGGLVPSFSPKPHLATDAALYRMLPFVIRPIGSDLVGVDRARFRLRRTLEISGDLYVAYYMRVVDRPSLSPPMKIKTIDLVGDVTIADYIPNVNNLRLADPDIGAVNPEVYVYTETIETVTFTQQDIDWIVEACELLYGRADQAIISEVGLCIGVDKPVTDQYPNTGVQTPTSFVGIPPTEIVACQISSFSFLDKSVYTSSGFTFTINTGVSEPLYGRET